MRSKENFEPLPIDWHVLLLSINVGKQWTLTNCKQLIVIVNNDNRADR